MVIASSYLLFAAEAVESTTTLAGAVIALASAGFGAMYGMAKIFKSILDKALATNAALYAANAELNLHIEALHTEARDEERARALERVKEAKRRRSST